MSVNQNVPLAFTGAAKVRGWMLLALLLVMSAAFSSAQAQVRAWFDRSTISMGETVTLNVESNTTGEPDFSVLDGHFRIVSRSTSSQMNIVNGAVSRVNLWAVALEPLRDGVVQVPAIKVGDASAEPLELTVQPLQRGSAANGDDVYLEVEVENTSPYVQQFIRYTVRLFYAVPLLEGNLDEPTGEGMQVRRIGQDINYSREVNGRRYNVVERNYSITPERSGELTVRGVTFRGRIQSPQRQSFFNQGVVKTTGSEDVLLTVRPAQNTAGEAWLPTQGLVLQDNLMSLPEEVKVGDALELVLVAEAVGLSAEQLPELRLPSIEGAEVYPDQETRENAERNGVLIGKRTRKFAIVPLREGTTEIPERSMSWWNTETDEKAMTMLPARRLTVLPGASVASEPSSTRGDEMPVNTIHTVTTSGSVWLWQSVSALLALGWLLTGGMWYLKSRREAIVEVKTDLVSSSAWRRPFKQALDDQDLSGAAKALLMSAPHLRDLGRLAEQLIHADQREAVSALERVLYRGESSAGVIDALRRAFTKPPAFASHTEKKKSAGLPPLYGAK